MRVSIFLVDGERQFQFFSHLTHRSKFKGLHVTQTPAGYQHQYRLLQGAEIKIADLQRLVLRSSPLSSRMSNAYMNTLASWRRYLMRSNSAIPSSPQTTASPSMIQDLERNRTRASMIRGKRAVRSLPGRL
jgi:hypothetical protein